MAGRKPKPTALKIIQGNPGRRPLNKKEPKPKIVFPEPPDHLTEYARKEWERLAPEMYAVGLLSNLDLTTYEGYCEAYSRHRIALEKVEEEGLVTVTTNGNVVQNIHVGISNKALELMRKFASELGITPSSRSRVTVNPPKEKKEDPWSNFG